MQKDLEKLQAQMEVARYDYETEMLRERRFHLITYFLSTK